MRGLSTIHATLPGPGGRADSNGESGTVTDRLRLEIEGPIAVITNDHPEKHNAFDDEMDAALFEILAELKARPDVRAVIWRGEGKSFSSGRDVGSIGNLKVPLSHHELMRRGHRDPAALGARRAGDRRVQGLGDGRLVPARCCATSASRRRTRGSGCPRSPTA